MGLISALQIILFGILFLFFIILLTFSPMHFLGFNVMPRRIPDFPDSFHSWNFLSSIGSGITFLSLAIFFYPVLILESKFIIQIKLLISALQIILFGILFLFFIILLSDYCPSINRSIVSVSTLQGLVCHYLAIAFQNHFSMISPPC